MKQRKFFPKNLLWICSLQFWIPRPKNFCQRPEKTSLIVKGDNLKKISNNDPFSQNYASAT